ncbi:MAG: hypothetical protein AB1921_08545 [Thermodesulfobacteriota bacterium]
MIVAPRNMLEARKYLKKALLLYILMLLTLGNGNYIYWYFKYPIVYLFIFDLGMNFDVVHYIVYELLIVYIVYSYDKNRYVLPSSFWVLAAIVVSATEIRSLLEWSDASLFVLTSLPVILLSWLYACGSYAVKRLPAPAAAG